MKKQILNIQIFNNQFVITYNDLKYEPQIIPYNENTKEELIRILKKETRLINKKKELLKNTRNVILAFDILSIFSTIFSAVLFNPVLLKIAMSFAFLEISIILFFIILACNCSINELDSNFDYNDLLEVERRYFKNRKVIDFIKYRENVMQRDELTLSKFLLDSEEKDNFKPKIVKFKQK